MLLYSFVFFSFFLLWTSSQFFFVVVEALVTPHHHHHHADSSSSSTTQFFPTPSSNSQSTTTTTTTTETETDDNVVEVVHTLILCRHGDSIWNGGEPGGRRETFTGWTDVPLSQKGIKEAQNTGQLVSEYKLGIDACFTSILQRAKLTAHYCLWAFADKPSHISPRKYIQDYRLNERHYGALQGFIKDDVERGIYGHNPDDVQRWRRSWYVVPPLLDDEDEDDEDEDEDTPTTDPRRIEEIKKFANFCGGPEFVPRGESLEQVANHRIRPFLDDVLSPILQDAAMARRPPRNDYNDNDDDDDDDDDDDTKALNHATTTTPTRTGGTGLVVAHANSLRALIGVLCDIENGPPEALQKLEALRLQTGVPLVLKFQKRDTGEYQVCDLEGYPILDKNSQRDIPVFPLSCIPMKPSPPLSSSSSSSSSSPQMRTTTTMTTEKKPLPLHNNHSERIESTTTQNTVT